MEKTPPWSGTYVFRGLSNPSSDAERITASLVIEPSGRFRYNTHTYDIGSGMRLSSRRGVLALERGGERKSDESGSWTLHVLNTTWRESSWNGEGEGSSDELERLVLSFTGTDKLLLEGRLLEREGVERLSSKL